MKFHKIDLDNLEEDQDASVPSAERRKFLKMGLVITGVYAGGKVLSLISGRGTAEAFNFDLSIEYPYDPHYSMVIRQDLCIDCERCMEACSKTNHVPSYGYRTRILERVDKKASGQKNEFIPVLCNQCNNPPCVRACPTSASIKNKENGIIQVHEERCIGCKACMLACAYNARYLKASTKTVDKCDFCYESRLSQGETLTACAAACPAGVRIFGNLSDSSSKVYQMVHQMHKPIWVLRPEIGAEPNVFYTKG